MRRLLFLVLMLSSAAAWADSLIEWELVLGPSVLRGTKYPSGIQACEAVGSWYIANGGGYYTGVEAVRDGDTGFICMIQNEGSDVLGGRASRLGDTCREGTEYNPATGSCDEPEQDCSDTVGDGLSSFFTGSVRTSAEEPFPVGPDGIDVPPFMCAQSCRYRNVTTGSTVTCGPLTGSDMLTLYCVGMFEGNGEKCQSGDLPQQGSGDIGGPDPVPPTDPDDPTDPANNCGPTHVWSGSICTPVFAPDPAEPGNGGDNGGNNGGGSGNNGGGSGDGGGNGDGDGDGNGDGSGDGSGGGGGGGGCGAGSCPEGGGDGEPHDWYVPGESTFGDVLSEFNQRMNSAPIISQTSQFFDINVGGSCPVWSVNAWVFQVVIDQHCTANIPWDLIRGVLIACASFVAFRWAFL